MAPKKSKNKSKNLDQGQDQDQDQESIPTIDKIQNLFIVLLIIIIAVLCGYIYFEIYQKINELNLQITKSNNSYLLSKPI